MYRNTLSAQFQTNTAKLIRQLFTVQLDNDLKQTSKINPRVYKSKEIGDADRPINMQQLKADAVRV